MCGFSRSSSSKKIHIMQSNQIDETKRKNLIIIMVLQKNQFQNQWWWISTKKIVEFFIEKNNKMTTAVGVIWKKWKCSICMLHGCIHWFIHNWSLSLLSLANDVHHKQKTKNFLFYCTLSIFSICFLEKIFASEKKRKSKINIIGVSH